MRSEMLRQPFTLLLHVALVVILTGACVTHFCGIQGRLELAEGSGSVTRFTKTSGPGDGSLPFAVRLLRADVEFYPGTSTPMDFRSCLDIDGDTATVAMNRVAEVRGWRFYQSGIGPDATRLAVSYDPWGTGITYAGYALLFVAIAGFFFQSRTLWRSLLRSARRGVAASMLLIALGANAATDEAALPAMQRPLAANLGKVYVYWNDRVCPMQTMAMDVSRKLYGSTSYRGLTAEQILSGWLFYFDTWQRDYDSFDTATDLSAKQQKLRDERRALIRWLGTGEAFKIYPYRAADGHTEWLSLTGRRPSKMSLDQWEFMQTTMPEMKRLLLAGRNRAANENIWRLVDRQISYAGGAENLPSATRIEAERIYNRFGGVLIPAMVALLTGAAYLATAIKGFRLRKWMAAALGSATASVLLYMLSMMAVLWWIGGHVPLSNGPEMMMFMALFALAGSLACRAPMLKGAFAIVAATTLSVALMGGRSPRIGMLMPVLASPLLSVHVMLVMTSYVFFLIMAILSAVGLATKNDSTAAMLSRYNRIILVPAVFLLAAGIFVGAIWANQSWGRYWGWDPKETCALVMLLVYSVPLHWGSRRLRAFRRPAMLHRYLLAAVLTLLFTYFGANYLLPGLHSYA